LQWWFAAVAELCVGHGGSKGAAIGGGASVGHGGARRQNWVDVRTSWRHRVAAMPASGRCRRPRALGGRPRAAAGGQPGGERVVAQEGRDRTGENGLLKRLGAVTPSALGPVREISRASLARLSCEARFELGNWAWLRVGNAQLTRSDLTNTKT
jgi:hypothetical protein